MKSLLWFLTAFLILAACAWAQPARAEGLSVTLTASPATVVQGGIITYTAMTANTNPPGPIIGNVASATCDEIPTPRFSGECRVQRDNSLHNVTLTCLIPTDTTFVDGSARKDGAAFVPVIAADQFDVLCGTLAPGVQGVVEYQVRAD